MKIEAIKNSTPLSTLVVYISEKDSKAVTTGLDKEIANIIQDAVKEETYSAAKNSTCLFRNSYIGDYKHLVVTCVGGNSHEDLRQASASAYKVLEANKIKNADVLMSNISRFSKKADEAAEACAQGYCLANYDFDDYKDLKNKKKASRFDSISFVADKKATPAKLKKSLEAAHTLSEAINFSRRLGDTPGNLMTPDILAKETQKAAKGTKLKVTVWDKARIKKEGMGGLLGVSLGSDAPPRFIIMEYKGAAASKKPICYVGKGLTFDAGGISIKPSAGMDEMKYDMCGGANVIGTMVAIAKLGLKVNAIAFVPSTENMLGGLANKPGDILTAHNGMTVEVFNTDAEGRLILMDALSYASTKKPALIVDAATLTGAMVVALANTHTGVFTRDKKLMGKIQKAADAAGEWVWQMPLTDFNSKKMKGKHADLQNIADSRWGGSSNAASFLEYFVDKKIPWAHFDIAGTGWNTSDVLPYTRSKGASGAMVRTFVELAKNH